MNLPAPVKPSNDYSLGLERDPEADPAAKVFPNTDLLKWCEIINVCLKLLNMGVIFI